MSITVREALSIEPLARGALVGGRRGLDRVIRWVTIVEVLEDVGRLQEGELLVTTAYELENDLDRRRTYIAQLAERKLAGVAVITGFYIKAVPPEMIEQADEHGLPLIQLPPSINFSDITRALLERIVNRQYELMHASESVHRELTALALGDCELDDIAAVVARWTGGWVTVTDGSGGRLAGAGETLGERSETVLAGVRRDFGDSILELPREVVVVDAETGSAYSALAAPIRASDRLFGALTLVKRKGSLQELDRVALGHASTVGALLLMRREAVIDEARRLRGDFLDRVLAGTSAREPHSVVEQARRFGCDFTRPHVAVVFRIRVTAPGVRGGARPFESVGREGIAARRATAGRLLGVVEHVLVGEGRSVLVREREGDVLSLIGADDPGEAALLVGAVLERWGAPGPGEGPLVAGVGEHAAEVSGFALSAQQAHDAARLGPLLPGAPLVVRHRDLGVYRLVADMERRRVDLDAAAAASLGPLADDTGRARRMLETLDAYLENDGNLQATAAALFVHRHTLRYRLKRIEELSGRRLRDPLDRLEFHLGSALLRYRRLRRAQSGES